MRTMRPLETLTAADFAAAARRPVPDRSRSTPRRSTPCWSRSPRSPREPGGRAPFSLVFRGGPSPPLPQRIYRVEHELLGAIEIFLVPIAADSYEAVFT